MNKDKTFILAYVTLLTTGNSIRIAINNIPIDVKNRINIKLFFFSDLEYNSSTYKFEDLFKAFKKSLYELYVIKCKSY